MPLLTADNETALVMPAPLFKTHSAPSPATFNVPAPRATWTRDQEALLGDGLQIVRYVARQVHERLPQHVELEELVSAGTLGLIDAVRRYNADRQVQFRSYATFRIRGAILDSLRSLDWSPRDLRRKGRALEEVASRLQGRLGRAANDEEIAGEMGVSLESVQSLRNELQCLEIGALNVPRGDDSGEEELVFVVAREEEGPLFQCLQGETRRLLRTAIGALPARERLVMTLYYFEERTMKEIGEVLGVVESRVSQMHHIAMHRLRVQLRDLRQPRPKQPSPVIRSTRRVG